MIMIEVPRMKPSVFVCAVVAVVAILLLQAPVSAIAVDEMVTQATLLDRIQIEDLLVRYYHVGAGFSPPASARLNPSE